MQRIIPHNIVEYWLQQPFISSPYVYLDRWSLIHFTVGFIFGYLFSKRFKIKQAWLVTLLILIAYEVVEHFLGNFIFDPEVPADTAWDIIVGMSGFTLFWTFLKWRGKKSGSSNPPNI